MRLTRRKRLKINNRSGEYMKERWEIAGRTDQHTFVWLSSDEESGLNNFEMARS